MMEWMWCSKIGDKQLFFVAPFTAAYDLKLAGGRRNKGLDIISLVTGPGQLHLHIARRWRQKIYF